MESVVSSERSAPFLYEIFSIYDYKLHDLSRDFYDTLITFNRNVRDGTNERGESEKTTWIIQTTNWLRSFIRRPLQKYFISTSTPSALLKVLSKMRSSLCEWKLAYAEASKILAIVKCKEVEIRSSSSGFKSILYRWALSDDPFPVWRSATWSSDGLFLLVAGSSGVIDVYLKDVGIIFRILPTSASNIPGNEASSSYPRTLVDLNESILYSLNESLRDPVCKMFCHCASQGQSFKAFGRSWKYRLVTLSYNNTVRVYLFNSPLESDFDLPMSPWVFFRDEIIPDSSKGKALLSFCFKKSTKKYHAFTCDMMFSKEHDCFIIVGRASKDYRSKYANVPGIHRFSCWRLFVENGIFSHVENVGENLSQMRKSMSELALNDKTGTSPIADDREDNDVSIGNSGFFGKFYRLTSSSGSFAESVVWKVNLSPDSRTLALVDLAGNLTIWELVSKRIICILKAESLTSMKDAGDSKSRVVNVTWLSDTMILVTFLDGNGTLYRLSESSLVHVNPEKTVIDLSVGSFIENTVESNLAILTKEEKLTRIPFFSDKSPDFHRSRVIAGGDIGDPGNTAGFPLTDDDWVSKLKFLIYRPFKLITDTFLWNFEADSQYSILKIPIYKFKLLRETSPLDLMLTKLQEGDFPTALKIAETHDLNTDVVYQFEWNRSEVSEFSIKNYLSKIRDKAWIASSCVIRVPELPSQLRLLLEFGIYITNQVEETVLQKIQNFGLQEPETQFDDNEITLCKFRFQIFMYLERLNLYEELEKSFGTDFISERVGLEAGKGEMFEDTFRTFREKSLVNLCIDFASSLKLDALKLLFERYGSRILNYRLGILEAIPETCDPALYSFLLPSVTGVSEVEDIVFRENSFAPGTEINRLEKYRELLLPQSSFENSETGLLSLPYPGPRSDLLCWLRERAFEIDFQTGIVPNLRSFITVAVGRGFQELSGFLSKVDLYEFIIYERSSTLNQFQELSFKKFIDLDEEEIVSLFLSQSTLETIESDVQFLVSSFLCNGNLAPLLNHLIKRSETAIEYAAKIIRASNPLVPDEKRIIKSDESLLNFALSCAYRITAPHQIQFCNEIFESLPQRSSMDTAEIIALHDQVDLLESHLYLSEVLEKYGFFYPLDKIKLSASDKDFLRQIVTKICRSLTAQSSDLDWRTMHSDLLSLQETYLMDLDETYILSAFSTCALYCQKNRVAKEILFSSSKRNEDYVKDAIGIVLTVATEFFDNADNFDTKRGYLKLAHDCLVLAPKSTAVADELELIDACEDISKVFAKSNLENEILPVNFRKFENRIPLLEGLISSHPLAYELYDKIVSIAKKLQGSRQSKLLETRIKVHIASVALSRKNYDLSFKLCDQLLMSGSIAKTLDTFPNLFECCTVIASENSYLNTSNRLKLIKTVINYCQPDKLPNLIELDYRLESEQYFAEKSKTTNKVLKSSDSSASNLIIQSPDHHMSKGEEEELSHPSRYFAFDSSYGIILKEERSKLLWNVFEKDQFYSERKRLMREPWELALRESILSKNVDSSWTLLSRHVYEFDLSLFFALLLLDPCENLQMETFLERVDSDFKDVTKVYVKALTFLSRHYDPNELCLNSLKDLLLLISSDQVKDYNGVHEARLSIVEALNNCFDVDEKRFLKIIYNEKTVDHERFLADPSYRITVLAKMSATQEDNVFDKLVEIGQNYNIAVVQLLIPRIVYMISGISGRKLETFCKKYLPMAIENNENQVVTKALMEHLSSPISAEKFDDFSEKAVIVYRFLLNLVSAGNHPLVETFEGVLRIQEEILPIKSYLCIDGRVFNVKNLVSCNYAGGPDYIEIVENMIEDSSIECLLNISEILPILKKVNLEGPEISVIEADRPLNVTLTKAKLSLLVLEKHLQKYQPKSIDIRFITESSHLKNLAEMGQNGDFVNTLIAFVFGEKKVVKLDSAISLRLCKSLRERLLALNVDIPIELDKSEAFLTFLSGISEYEGKFKFYEMFQECEKNITSQIASLLLQALKESESILVLDKIVSSYEKNYHNIDHEKVLFLCLDHENWSSEGQKGEIYGKIVSEIEANPDVPLGQEVINVLLKMTDESGSDSSLASVAVAARIYRSLGETFVPTSRQEDMVNCFEMEEMEAIFGRDIMQRCGVTRKMLSENMCFCYEALWYSNASVSTIGTSHSSSSSSSKDQQFWWLLNKMRKHGNRFKMSSKFLCQTLIDMQHIPSGFLYLLLYYGQKGEEEEKIEITGSLDEKSKIMLEIVGGRWDVMEGELASRIPPLQEETGLYLLFYYFYREAALVQNIKLMAVDKLIEPIVRLGAKVSGPEIVGKGFEGPNLIDLSFMTLILDLYEGGDVRNQPFAGYISGKWLQIPKSFIDFGSHKRLIKEGLDLASNLLQGLEKGIINGSIKCDKFSETHLVVDEESSVIFCLLCLYESMRDRRAGLLDRIQKHLFQG